MWRRHPTLSLTNSRDLNRARVFEVIHLFEPVSRSEIAQHVGLTAASISYIVAELLELGYVIELGRRSSSRGQPAIEMGVAANSAYTLGLHFSHERIRGAVVDLKGNIIIDIVEDLPRPPTPAAVIKSLVRIGKLLKNEVPDGKPLAAGLASVGPIDLVQGSVTQTAFTTDWNNVQLRLPLAEALNLPVYMDNNATVAAIGEFWYGMGRDYRNFLHITFFGNGLGGGLFLDRRVYRGASLNAAEFGHFLVHPEKPIKGVTPYLENYVSGYALQRDLGENILVELPERIKTGEKTLSAWLDSASDLFAKALVSVDHMLNLDAIIIGGQLPSEFINALLQRVSKRLDDYYMPGWAERAKLRQCCNGDDNAVLGAATLPIYDVLALTAHGTGATSNLFKSDAEAGPMQ